MDYKLVAAAFVDGLCFGVMFTKWEELEPAVWFGIACMAVLVAVAAIVDYKTGREGGKYDGKANTYAGNRSRHKVGKREPRNVGNIAGYGSEGRKDANARAAAKRIR